jgi:hypothetical protein
MGSYLMGWEAFNLTAPHPFNLNASDPFNGEARSAFALYRCAALLARSFNTSM